MARTQLDREYPYYPAFLDLRHKRVVVIGGGVIGTEKVQGLLPCGAEPLVVVAPTASPLIQQAAAAGSVQWVQRAYSDGDLAGAAVAFAATNDRALNATVAGEARWRNIPVLAVDDVPNCDFIAPAIVRRGDVIVAISTGGRSPAFARWLRERLDAAIPSHWGYFLTVAAEARQRLRTLGQSATPDRWQEALDAEAEQLAATGQHQQAVERVLAHLIEKAPSPR